MHRKARRQSSARKDPGGRPHRDSLPATTASRDSVGRYWRREYREAFAACPGVRSQCVLVLRTAAPASHPDVLNSLQKERGGGYPGQFGRKPGDYFIRAGSAYQLRQRAVFRLDPERLRQIARVGPGPSATGDVGHGRVRRPFGWNLRPTCRFQAGLGTGGRFASCRDSGPSTQRPCRSIVFPGEETMHTAGFRVDACHEEPFSWRMNMRQSAAGETRGGIVALNVGHSRHV